MKNTLLIVLMIILSGCALQQDVVSLNKRLAQSEHRYAEAQKKNKELEAKLDEYSKVRKQDDRELRTKTASQYATIEKLREEIQIISGRLEETDYLLKQKIYIREQV